MCSLKSLHCLLDAVRFSAVCFAHSAKDVSNLSHSVWSRSFFNLFPSPFFCVTNFNAVYLELSANEWTSARARVHFIALPALNSSLFSRALILVCSCGCCCCWLGSALSSLFFSSLGSMYCLTFHESVCVLFFHFWFFILKRTRRTLSSAFNTYRFVRLRIANRKFDKKCKIRVTWNDVKT